jgi:hypothetical protein
MYVLTSRSSVLLQTAGRFSNGVGHFRPIFLGKLLPSLARRALQTFAPFAAFLLVAGQAQAIPQMVAGWDFSQYTAPEGFLVVAGDAGPELSPTLDANYSDKDPNGLGAESAQYGTMYADGQFGSHNQPAALGPLTARSGNIPANQDAPTSGVLLGDPANSATLVLTEDSQGSFEDKRLQAEAGDVLGVVFSADLSVNPLEVGSNWQVSFAGQTASGTSDLSVEFSTDGTNYSLIDTVLLDTSVQQFVVELSGTDLTQVFVRLGLDGDPTTLPGIDNVAIKADVTETGGTPVDFPDRRLEFEIRIALGKPTGDILSTDLEGLTELEADGVLIRVLTGLEYCVNLERLYLTGNRVSDVSPLQGLTKLTDLDLSSNVITDITLLEGLINLTDLRLSNNQIGDISPLVDIVPNLGILYADRNQISDIAVLSGLTGTSVDLAYNQISDISPLEASGLDGGDDVDLRDNPLNCDPNSADNVALLEGRGVTVDRTDTHVCGNDCSDGIDNDADGLADHPDDVGCENAGDPSERSPSLACDDGSDNDGDLWSDYPNDPACFSPGTLFEQYGCQDGVNNDAAEDDSFDYDGGASLDLDGDGFVDAAFNPAEPEVTGPDPQCEYAWQVEEKLGPTWPIKNCGLGIELAILLPPLTWLWRRRRSKVFHS